MSNTLSKILLVEDDLNLCEIAKIALHDVGGFDVKICTSGKECLAIAPQYQPDLILLDVVMPEMDGPSTLKKLRETDACQKSMVIFLTAKVRPDEIQMLKTFGAKAVIAKPFNPITLAEEITSIYNT